MAANGSTSLPCPGGCSMEACSSHLQQEALDQYSSEISLDSTHFLQVNVSPKAAVHFTDPTH
jgi:hypothetical protein